MVAEARECQWVPPKFIYRLLPSIVSLIRVRRPLNTLPPLFSITGASVEAFVAASLNQEHNSVTKLVMEGLRIIVLVVCIFLSAISSAATHEVSVSCMMVYDRGGAPAVFESPECPQWVLSTESHKNHTENCQFATLQGHREYQEDRITCNLEMKIPFPGKNAIKDIMVGIAAVFDGHGGKEASEMASKHFSEYFFLHVLFKAYQQASSYMAQGNGHNNRDETKHHNISSEGALPVHKDESIIHGIMKEALLSTIQDIDHKFSMEALNNKYFSGSTATVVLLVNGQILAANVGDSKALLCSKRIQVAAGSTVAKLHAKELTRDHHPNREDERARIEAYGGFVSFVGVPRANGILAMSRSIGDIGLKRYGVIAEPEFEGWLPLSANDRYLVVASDGIFESLTPDDVCDLLGDAHIQENVVSQDSFSCSSSHSLAECIVHHALMEGSNDNLSAIVVPLRSAGSS